MKMTMSMYFNQQLWIYYIHPNSYNMIIKHLKRRGSNRIVDELRSYWYWSNLDHLYYRVFLLIMQRKKLDIQSIFLSIHICNKFLQHFHAIFKFMTDVIDIASLDFTYWNNQIILTDSLSLYCFIGLSNCFEVSFALEVWETQINREIIFFYKLLHEVCIYEIFFDLL